MDPLISIEEAFALRDAGFPQISYVGDYVYHPMADKIMRCIKSDGKPMECEHLPTLIPRRSQANAWLADRAMNLLPVIDA